MEGRFEDAARIVLADGLELKNWTSYSINSDFLTPTDGWSFTFGGRSVPNEVLERIQPDMRVQVYVGDSLQLTGWIDSVRIAGDSSSGTVFNVQGRDILRPLCKSHIHPDTPFKGRTVAQLVEAVLRMHYFPPPTLFYDNDSNVKLVTGGAGTVSQKQIDDAKAKAESLAAQAKRDADKDKQSTTTTAPKSVAAKSFTIFADAAARAEKEAKQLAAAGASASSLAQKTIDYVQPHPNEGAFEFVARNLRRFGLWMWATADGSICISKPSYDQEPRYILQRKRGDKLVTVTHAEYTYDRTNIPSQITVRGKSQGKEFEKSTVKGYIADVNARDVEFFEPFYLQHDQATTPEGAAAFAAQEMSHLKQNERVYECTCPGHRDPRTQNIYAVDTIAAVEDDVCGVSELMWIVSRTFNRSVSGGTTTTLKLLPKGAVIFSDADATDMARKKKGRKK